MREEGYDPWSVAESSEDLMRVLEAIRDNDFNKNSPDLFRELYHELTDHGDFYFYLADFEEYILCNDAVDTLYKEPNKKQSITTN